MASFASDPVGTYTRYIDACNDREFDQLGSFIAADVEGVRSGLDGYRDGLADIVAAFPDFHWRVEQVIVDGSTIAARLTDTGTHRRSFAGIAPVGHVVRVQELAIYRIDGEGKIAQCWGDLEAVLRSALQPNEQ
ncbi:hypothetical protein BJF84_15875 [Rhodococcus sp. CUA-806]|jgi:predicted ester cyclase|nr:hypothetical protein BJF84_15875 [Rhodococcus sp. CUA-806]